MILLLLVLLVVGPLKPDPVLTPGVVRPLTKATVCATKWGVDHRRVTPAMKRAVFKAYAIPYVQHGLSQN